MSSAGPVRCDSQGAAGRPVLSWQEHAERSLYKTGFSDECWPHELDQAEPVPSEMMVRMSCRGCPGRAWVAYHPAVEQGASGGDLIQLVEGLVNGG